MTLSITKKDLNLLVNLSDDDLVITMRLIHQLQNKKLPEAREHYQSNLEYITTQARELLDSKFEKAEKAAEKAAERRRQPRKPKTQEPAEPSNTVTTPFTREFMDFLKENWHQLHNFFHRHCKHVDTIQCEYEKIISDFFDKAPKQTFVEGYEFKRMVYLNGRNLSPIVLRKRPRLR